MTNPINLYSGPNYPIQIMKETPLKDNEGFESILKIFYAAVPFKSVQQFYLLIGKILCLKQYEQDYLITEMTRYIDNFLGENYD